MVSNVTFQDLKILDWDDSTHFEALNPARCVISNWGQFITGWHPGMVAILGSQAG